MRIGMVTREWPPDVYGGAGVHVEHLAAALRALPDGPELDVHCFGGPREDATGHAVPAGLSGANGALQALGVDVEIAGALAGVDLVHSHTWYANAAGLLAALVHGVPHVVTAHFPEPRRPWKADQLGGGYRLSSWVERTAHLTADAVVAVSAGMRDDVLAVYPELDPARVHVVHNGVDAEAYRPVEAPDVVRRLGVDPARPYALFVGRITRQKGVPHLLAAAEQLPPPDDPTTFEAGLATRVAELLADPDRAAAMGAAGRERVLAEFGWPAVARRTVDVYSAVLGARS
ncbi:glycosyltransferase [Geodermatophilus sabuli]|uniref:glycosyltransferase n=1 Tax=Geodermatophilus sabuli TaxID=1564158 RepID=UPI0016152473|nr:glycosyltransferase [Geodermatophilus sabuli]MBB3082984.1 starch synthase [Geodermatophilus sabuli]